MEASPTVDGCEKLGGQTLASPTTPLLLELDDRAFPPSSSTRSLRESTATLPDLPPETRIPSAIFERNQSPISSEDQLDATPTSRTLVRSMQSVLRKDGVPVQPSLPEYTPSPVRNETAAALHSGDASSGSMLEPSPNQQSNLHALQEQVHSMLMQQATSAHHMALLQAEIEELRMGVEPERLPSYTP